MCINMRSMVQHVQNGYNPNYSEWKILYKSKTLQKGDCLTIPLFVKSFDNISLKICIINSAKGISVCYAYANRK